MSRVGQANVFRWYKDLKTEGDWLKARAGGVGGSDIAKLVGVSRWGNPLTVYLDKINPLASTVADNEAMELGRDLEDWTARKFAARTGLRVRRVNAILQHPEHPRWLANIDRLVLSADGKTILGVLECKTAGSKDDWLDNKIPEDYLCQGEWYCGVTGLPKIWFAALCGGFGGMSLEIREREADPSLFADLGNIANDFWSQHVETGEAPAADGTQTSTDALSRLFPEAYLPEIELPTTAAFVAASYLDAKAKAKEASELEETYKNQLKLMLGEFERGIVEGFQLSWKNIDTQRFDQQRFTEEHPDMAAQYMKPTRQRRLYCKEKTK